MSLPLILAAAWLFGNSQEKPKRPRPVNERKQPRADLVPSAAVAPPVVAPNLRAVAESLRDFLERTRKFGTKNNRISEVLDAQRALGVQGEDGIVGPKTRKAARAVGVTLPLRK